VSAIDLPLINNVTRRLAGKFAIALDTEDSARVAEPFPEFWVTFTGRQVDAGLQVPGLEFTGYLRTTPSETLWKIKYVISETLENRV
jgi:hypothetical protein